MSNRQFNVELPADVVRAVKIDCVKLGVTLGDYTAEAFRQFRSNKISDLAPRFVNRRKRTGRRITLSHGGKLP
jgi:hypothetical protein